jgi:hypothetical protein
LENRLSVERTESPKPKTVDNTLNIKSDTIDDTDSSVVKYRKQRASTAVDAGIPSKEPFVAGPMERAILRMEEVEQLVTAHEGKHSERYSGAQFAREKSVQLAISSHFGLTIGGVGNSTCWAGAPGGGAGCRLELWWKGGEYTLKPPNKLVPEGVTGGSTGRWRGPDRARPEEAGTFAGVPWNGLLARRGDSTTCRVAPDVPLGGRRRSTGTLECRGVFSRCFNADCAEAVINLTSSAGAD